MGKLHKIRRKTDKTITVEVLFDGEIINGKYVGPGNLKVVSGMNHEVYWITPQTCRDGYEVTAELEEDIRRASER